MRSNWLVENTIIPLYAHCHINYLLSKDSIAHGSIPSNTHDASLRTGLQAYYFHGDRDICFWLLRSSQRTWNNQPRGTDWIQCMWELERQQKEKILVIPKRWVRLMKEFHNRVRQISRPYFSSFINFLWWFKILI